MSQSQSKRSPLASPLSVLVIGIVLVTLIGVWARPFAFPVDETRYLAVAWEMWWRDDFVLPWINGQPYDHKPPLLFWLIHAGWTVFGVNDWWPRWIGPLCILLAAVALAKLGRRVYPQVADAGAYAALLVFSTTYLAVYQTGIMFDALLLVAITTGWLGLHAAVTRGQWRDWGLFALGGALGMLTKGPVTLLYLLPALLAATLWRPSGAPPLHLSRAVVAVLAMVVPVLLWAFAAGMQGGEQYLRDLLISQTAKRVQGAMGHPRPFYWYLPLLLLLSLPWLLWWPLWKAGWSSWKHSTRARLAMPWWLALPALLALMLVSGKQVHYLIPVMAALALPLAAALQRSDARASRWHAIPMAAMNGVLFPVLILLLPAYWPQANPPTIVQFAAAAVAILTAIAMLLWAPGPANRVMPHLALLHVIALGALLVGVMSTIRPDYDLRPMAVFVAEQQAQGRSIGYVGVYQGELHFAGRLKQRIEPVPVEDALAWSAAHPHALLMMRSKRVNLLPQAHVEARTRYKRAEWLAISTDEFTSGRAEVIDPLIRSERRNTDG